MDEAEVEAARVFSLDVAAVSSITTLYYGHVW
jgi:hypothetical protein